MVIVFTNVVAYLALGAAYSAEGLKMPSTDAEEQKTVYTGTAARDIALLVVVCRS